MPIRSATSLVIDNGGESEVGKGEHHDKPTYKHGHLESSGSRDCFILLVKYTHQGTISSINAEYCDRSKSNWFSMLVRCLQSVLTLMMREPAKQSRRPSAAIDSLITTSLTLGGYVVKHILNKDICFTATTRQEGGELLN